MPCRERAIKVQGRVEPLSGRRQRPVTAGSPFPGSQGRDTIAREHERARIPASREDRRTRSSHFSVRELRSSFREVLRHKCTGSLPFSAAANKRIYRVTNSLASHTADPHAYRWVTLPPCPVTLPHWQCYYREANHCQNTAYDALKE